MRNRDDPATVCLVAELDRSFVHKKVRIAGKILSYDPSTHLLLLVHQASGILIDMSLCLDPSQSLYYLRESKGTLMVLGILDDVPVAVSLDVPMLPQFTDAPSLDDRLVLRALVVRGVNDLSLDLWSTALEALKAQRHDMFGSIDSLTTQEI